MMNNLDPMGCGTALREANKRIEELERENARLAAVVKELTGAIRGVNHRKCHEIRVPGDDEPCYWQRKEWVEWMMELADECEKALQSVQEVQKS